MNKIRMIFLILFLSIFCGSANVKAESKLVCKYEQSISTGLATIVLDGSLSSSQTTVKYYWNGNLEYTGVTDLYPLSELNNSSQECPSFVSFIANNTIFEKKYELIGLQWGVAGNFEKMYGKTCKNGSGGYSCFDFFGASTGGKITVGLNDILDFPGENGKIEFTKSFIMNPCDESDEFFKVFNLLTTSYQFLKVAAPIILVVFGSIDMAKAVTSSDEGKMKKAQSAFVRRIIAALIVFLSFVIVEFIIKLSGDTLNSDILKCIDKIF